MKTLYQTMACGCYWAREPHYGDVLYQCPRHKKGEKYEGSEPMAKEELEEFVEGLNRSK